MSGRSTNQGERDPAHPPKSSDVLRWERGYRCHGLWRDDRRVGFIGLGPRGVWDGIYRWSAEGPSGDMIDQGEAKTLNGARRQVERALASA